MRIVHIIFGLIGAFLFALTFVMRESTEGVWVNRIEEFWIEVDDRKKSIGESTKILFRKIADKVSRAFNRVFGPKLISVRTIGMSGSLSFASFFLILAVMFEGVSYFIIKHSDVLKPELTKQVPLLAILGIGLFFVAGFCLLLAVLPILLKSPVWAWISCIPTVFLLELTYQLFHKHLGNAKEYGDRPGFSDQFRVRRSSVDTRQAIASMDSRSYHSRSDCLRYGNAVAFSVSSFRYSVWASDRVASRDGKKQRGANIVRIGSFQYSDCCCVTRFRIFLVCCITPSPRMAIT